MNTKLEFLITSLKAAPMKLSLTSPDNTRVIQVILARVTAISEEVREVIKNTPANKDVLKRLDVGFSKMRNRAKSVQDLIDNDDITDVILKDYVVWQVRCADVITSLISSVDKSSVSDDNEDDMQELQVIASEASDNEESEASNIFNKILSEAEKAIIHYSMYSTKMPRDGSKTNKPFTVNEFPIIPLFSGSGIAAKYFNALGINTKEIGFYIVLEKQLCVGINTHVESGIDIDDIVNALEERQKRKWSVMGTPKKDKNGYLWYWLLPNAILDKLSHEGKHLKISQWGFAFKRD